jgi:hypothetical protein
VINYGLCCISLVLSEKGDKFQTLTYTRFKTLGREEGMRVLSKRILNNFNVNYSLDNSKSIVEQDIYLLNLKYQNIMSHIYNINTINIQKLLLYVSSSNIISLTIYKLSIDIIKLN